MPIEDFFIAYGKQDRRPGEFVERITVPRPAPGTRFRAYKIAKRFDQDISATLAAFNLRLDGDRVDDARVAFGGMAATPKRAPTVESRLKGSIWNEATVQAAVAAMEQDFQPITDWRASAEYRMQVSKNLLMRCYVETTDPAAETRMVGDRAAAHA